MGRQKGILKEVDEVHQCQLEECYWDNSYTVMLSSLLCHRILQRNCSISNYKPVLSADLPKHLAKTPNMNAVYQSFFISYYSKVDLPHKLIISKKFPDCLLYFILFSHYICTRNQNLWSCSRIWDVALWDEPNIELECQSVRSQ